MAYTPMIEQYLQIKENYRDCILFFRLGDFYEMFFDDALVASRDMEITLTKKACGDGEFAPMCGVPYHAVDTYLSRLIAKGHKVAICEQTSDPAESKGIVEREVIRIVTPGTVLSSDMLDEHSNNFLMCIFKDEQYDVAWVDISTAEFFNVKITGEGKDEQLLSELIKLQPREIISDIDFSETAKMLDNCSCSIYKKADGAADNIIAYLKETQKQDITHLRPLRVLNIGDSMSLDKASIRNLELTETLYERQVQGSLLGILDKTKTAMGSRKMKAWLREPLIKCGQIEERLNAVDCFVSDVILKNNIREYLKPVYDLERLSSRIATGTANARDLVALKNSLSSLPDIKAELGSSNDKLLSDLNAKIADLRDLFALIDSSIKEEPPFTVREGGLIKEGFSEELDALNNSISDKTRWIAELENSEKERTGIRTLKLGYNKVFGYYIEVSKALAAGVPENYIRKQTLVNAERFITPELKEAESVVLNAQTKINDLEYRLFKSVCAAVSNRRNEILESASALASIDVLASFAEVSVKYNYVKPEVNEGDAIVISKGRHPVIERYIKDGLYVSNDVYLDRDDNSMLLITGPNMSGKSTYMRQLALIVLMAQSGCFVPADSAKIGICDRIYTRIGASDNLAMGQSTFYVEMSELAYILNTATEKSLVILDEIGRGTSTYDGLSIAWAVVEALTKPKKQVRTLFATHYHELTALSGEIRGVENLNVDVSEENGNIVFLHKIIPGSASKSYGIHVAKLAGVDVAHYLEVNRYGLRKLEELLGIDQSQAPLDNPDAVVGALAKKVFGSSNEQLATRAENLETCIAMDMDSEQLVALCTGLQGMDTDSELYTETMPSVTEESDGQTYTAPNVGDWTTMVTRVASGMSPVASVQELGDYEQLRNANEVDIWNGVGVTGVAGDCAEELEKHGWTIATTTNAAQFVYEETLVVYSDSDNEQAAQLVVADLGQGRVVRSAYRYNFTGDILVVVGKDYQPH